MELDLRPVDSVRHLEEVGAEGRMKLVVRVRKREEGVVEQPAMCVPLKHQKHSVLLFRLKSGMYRLELWVVVVPVFAQSCYRPCTDRTRRRQMRQI